MAKNNFYQAKKEIRGKEYTCQFSGISTALRALDESYIEGSSNTSTAKFADFLFEHVVVEPKGLTTNDFDTLEEFNEVVKFAREVMNGEFRPKEK